MSSQSSLFPVSWLWLRMSQNGLSVCCPEELKKTCQIDRLVAQPVAAGWCCSLVLCCCLLHHQRMHSPSRNKKNRAPGRAARTRQDAGSQPARKSSQQPAPAARSEQQLRRPPGSSKRNECRTEREARHSETKRGCSGRASFYLRHLLCICCLSSRL